MFVNLNEIRLDFQQKSFFFRRCLSFLSDPCSRWATAEQAQGLVFVPRLAGRAEVAHGAREGAWYLCEN